MRISVRNVLVVTAFLTVGMLAGFASHSNGATTKPVPQRWEYNLLSVDMTDAGVQKLNDAGNSGWELVGIQSTSSMTRYVFKRPLN